MKKEFNEERWKEFLYALTTITTYLDDWHEDPIYQEAVRYHIRNSIEPVEANTVKIDGINYNWKLASEDGNNFLQLDPVPEFPITHSKTEKLTIEEIFEKYGDLLSDSGIEGLSKLKRERDGKE